MCDSDSSSSSSSDSYNSSDSSSSYSNNDHPHSYNEDSCHRSSSYNNSSESKCDYVNIISNDILNSNTLYNTLDVISSISQRDENNYIKLKHHRRSIENLDTNAYTIRSILSGSNIGLEKPINFKTKDDSGFSYKSNKYLFSKSFIITISILVCMVIILSIF